jgi:glucoamylase
VRKLIGVGRSLTMYVITDLGLPFYEAPFATSSIDVNTGTFGPSDARFPSVIEYSQITGDQFLEIVKAHVDAEGSMSEQFDRVTGYMRGAEDLTWSYGALFIAIKLFTLTRETICFQDQDSI